MYKLKMNEILPDGFRNITDEEVAARFAKLDTDKSYTITKNEWMASCLEVLIADIHSLDAIAPDSIMKSINDLSDEFDKYDTNHDKEIDFYEFKDFLTKNVLISE